MNGPLKSLGPGALRSELSYRNLQRKVPAEQTYGSIPSVVYQQSEDGLHGNFLSPSYKRIQSRLDWKARLAKAYTGSRRIPRAGDRKRRELDCANSSDALLMNIFCYPGVTHRAALCSLLCVGLGNEPAFGVRANIPLVKGKDRSEVDLRLGDLWVEAKLTEGDFQTARPAMIHRYRDLEEVFEVACLPLRNERFRGCQVIRGALAAHAHHVSFAVFCDQRRQDLVEECFGIISAIHRADLRCRMSVVTWQELATTLPPKVKKFLADKYGIAAVD